MPRWSLPVPDRSRVLWAAVGLALAGMSVVETATDTVYDYGLVTSLPGVAVGVLLALSPRWPTATALAGAFSVLGNYALDTPGPGGAQLIGMGVLIGHAAAVLPPRRGALTAAAAALVVVGAGFFAIPSPWEGLFYLLVAGAAWGVGALVRRSEEHTSELQSRQYLVCRLLLDKTITSWNLVERLPTVRARFLLCLLIHTIKATEPPFAGALFRPLLPSPHYLAVSLSAVLPLRS